MNLIAREGTPEGGVGWLFHSTAMVVDYDAACDRLSRLAGLRVLESSSMDEIGRRGGMTWLGDNSIEIGEPLGPETAVARFVRDHGGGIHSIAVKVGDLDAAADHLESRGVRVAARPRPDFLFSDPRDTRGVFVQWADFVVPEDPRSGAVMPDYRVEPLLEVVEHAFVGAIVDDPFETAEFLADLFSTSVTFEAPDAAPGYPSAGVSLGDCTLALYTLPGDRSMALWGREHQRARTHLVGLTVRDLDGAATVLAEEGFGIVWRDDETVVVDPTSTAGVQIALVGDLLLGDPRRSPSEQQAPG